MKYCIYVLFKNNAPIYVGLTANMAARLKFHRRSVNKGKDFDSYCIVSYIYTYSKKEAIAAEQCLITFVKSINPAIVNKYCKPIAKEISPYPFSF